MFKTTYYILRQLSFTTVLITMVLTGAIWLTQSLRFVNIVINKGLPISTFIELIMFLLPDLICVVLPGALLVATLYTYNRITADNELVVMRSIGMSNWQIAKPVIILATVLTVLLYSVTLYILPHAYRNFKDLEYGIRNTLSAAMLQEGEFNSFKGVTIYIKSRQGPRNISGIILHDARNPKKPFTTTAEHGSLLETDTGLRIILANGIRHEAHHKSRQPSMLYFDQHIIDLDNPSITKVRRYRKPNERFLGELLSPEGNISKIQRAKFVSEGHQRLLTPLNALAFALIGIVIMLQGDFNRRGRSKRMVLAVALCCSLQVITLGLINLSEKVFLAIPTTYIVVLTTIGLGLGLLFRTLDAPMLLGARTKANTRRN